MEKIVNLEKVSKTFKIRTNMNLFTGLFRPDYKFVQAISDVSFSVNKGESLAFIGPNGAGKTTTTKILSGLIFPSEGSVEVLGYTPFERKHDYLRQIGLVMGNKKGLSWDLTSRQNFELYKRIYRTDNAQYESYLSELCEILDIKDYLDIQVRKLSLGERMKMELIGAILHKPKVLFLDEPTIGLDITAKKNIRNFLRKIQKESNITLILTSHDMDDVEKVCDRVVVINKGVKVYDDRLEKLVSDYTKIRFIKVFFEEIPENLEKYYYAKVDERNKDSVTFELDKEYVPRLMSDVVTKNNVIDIDIVPVPLEDIIEDIFKKEVKSIV